MSTAKTIGEDNATRTNALGIYLREINRVALLSQTEEASLTRRAKTGDRLAREKLIQANLRFVVTVAREYHTHALPLEDLISEGNIGLMRAIDSFDTEKGNRFLSYAVWWIRQAMLRAISEKSRLIRLPRNKANELLQIAKVREDLQRNNYVKCKSDVIAERLHRDRHSVSQLLNISCEVRSLETPSFSEDGPSPLEDFIEDKKRMPTEEILIETSLRDDINTALSSLSQRESEILQCRYGLNGKRPMTLQAIGNRCKLTKERIRQIEKKAIKRLRHPSRSNLLRSYL